MNNKAKEIVSRMTLEEKAALLSGKNFWESKAFEEYGISSHMFTDGPHGLRKQTGGSDHLGINRSEPAACFPTAAATGCSFDPELMFEMGQALGDKCIREDVSVILGPGVNMKRSPLCGRNFEYFSEDPVLAGEIAAGLINGVQSTGTGTSLKHFAANNQEFSRMVIDAAVDERALREIYFPAFEIAVKKAQPRTVMCSYNKINGQYSSGNKWLLTDVLRNEWDFEGLVITDWGAMDDSVAGVRAGCDLEMPYCGEAHTQRIVEAVRNGDLSETEVDQCAERMVELCLKAQEPKTSIRSDEDDHELAGKVAEESAVLLKNGGMLPLRDGETVLIIGEMAEHPRYQGAGSSKIVPTRLDDIVHSAESAGKKIKYAQGYHTGSGQTDAELLAEAVSAAKDAEKVIVVAGLPDEYESEGFDRVNFSMPASQNELIAKVAEVNTNVAVVLQCGSAVELPWKDSVNAILLTYLAGQAGGSAAVRLLWGEVNPSGKLAETWPEKVGDNPSCAYFPGQVKAVEYRESIFIGYRYYDSVGMKVNYPFGFGLSYTDFRHSDLQIVPCGDGYDVSVTVTNIGDRFGKEVTELYVAMTNSKIFRASHELKAFAKTALEPGESKTVTMHLAKDAFRYYNTEAEAFCIEGGEYTIEIGKSSRDIVLSGTVTVCGDGKEELLLPIYSGLSDYALPSIPFRASKEQFEKLLGHAVPSGALDKKGEFTTASCLEDLKNTLLGKLLHHLILNRSSSALEDNADEGMKRMAASMVLSMPLRAFSMAGSFTLEQVEGLVTILNGHFFKGIKQMRAGKK